MLSLAEEIQLEGGGFAAPYLCIRLVNYVFVYCIQWLYTVYSVCVPTTVYLGYLVPQIAGALAERGYSLEEVTSAAQKVADNIGKRLLFVPHSQTLAMCMTLYLPQPP